MSRPRSAVLRRSAALLLVVPAVVLAGCSGTGSSDPTTAATTQEPPSLTSSGWVVSGYVDAQDQSVDAADVDGDYPSLQLREGGTVAGTTGCNSIAGSWTGSGQAVRITVTSKTPVLCPTPEATDQEAAILAALPQVASYKLSGGTLDLVDSSGAVVLRLREVVASPSLASPEG